MIRAAASVGLLALAAAGSMGAEPGPPPQVLSRLRAVVDLDARDPGFVGSWTLVAETVVSTAGGRNTREVSMAVRLTRAADGSTRRRLLRFVENGEDLTARRRAKIDGTEPPAGSTRAGKEDLRLPLGKDVDLYRFGAPSPGEGLMEASFEPEPGREAGPGLARGTLAWDPDTLDPVRLDFEVPDPPGPLRELRGTLRFQRLGGRLHVVEKRTEGLARLLLMQRRFRSTVRFESIEPAERGARDPREDGDTGNTPGTRR